MIFYIFKAIHHHHHHHHHHLIILFKSGHKHEQETDRQTDRQIDSVSERKKKQYKMYNKTH